MVSPVNLLACVTCALAMTSQVLVAQARLKPVYILGIVNGFLFVLLNGMIAAEASSQAAVALLMLPSAWLIVTSSWGLYRFYSFQNSASAEKPAISQQETAASQ